MARVTIEDCLEVVENRFVLVHTAVQRTKQQFRGSAPLVACKNREVVTALREIAEGKVRIQAQKTAEAGEKRKGTRKGKKGAS